MSTYTHLTAPTEFVEAAGIRFAYRRFANRRFGVAIDIPLLFFMHFSGSMSAGSGSKSLEHSWLCGGCSKRMTIICANQSEVKTGVSGKLREPQHPVTGLPGSISNVNSH